ncbi:hypothetical protein AOLI_G00013740 [Acnodon oligacanthus]
MKVLGGVKISRRIKTPPNPPRRFRRRTTPHFFRLALSYRTVSSGSDPCYNYTVLDEPWRATNYSNPWNVRCDQSVSWLGWYRLMYNGQDVRMPESCVNAYMCGTNAPLWMNGAHPRLQDGVVTLQICGNWAGDCCYFKSGPVRVKACLGNYYVSKNNISPPFQRETCSTKTFHIGGLQTVVHQNDFFNQLKELVRKGLLANITLQLKSISKQKNVKSETEEPGTC